MQSLTGRERKWLWLRLLGSEIIEKFIYRCTIKSTIWCTPITLMKIRKILIEAEIQEKILHKHGIKREELENALLEGKTKFKSQQ